MPAISAGSRQALQTMSRRPAGDDLRGWEWYYLLSLCHQDERTLMDHVGASVVGRLEPGRALPGLGEP